MSLNRTAAVIMAIICRDARILFIMVPRTGGSAIGKALCEELGGEFLPRHPLTDARGMIVMSHKHNTLEQLFKAKLVPRQEADHLFKFAGVRNPFDSLVSLYLKKRHKYQKNLADADSWVHYIPGYREDMQFCRDHSFDEWIARRYRDNSLRRLLGRGRHSMFARFTKDVDFVVRFEQLHDDFSEALRRAGVTRRVELPIVNVTDKREPNYRIYYSEASRRAVETAFRGDLEQYGYHF